jgi:hypothetical protein
MVGVIPKQLKKGTMLFIRPWEMIL